MRIEGELNYPPVFVVGCPRSGTTWISRILGTHPLILDAGESHFFASIEALYAHYEQSRYVGLANYVSRSQLDDLVRRLYSDALGHYLASVNRRRTLTLRTRKVYVVDKTPRHIFHLHRIRRAFPDSHFIHVVRDGRDVVTSMLRGSKQDWGSSWLPKTVADGAVRWRENFDYLVAHPEVTAHQYGVVRYEDMISDPEREVERILVSLRVPYQSRDVATMVRENVFTPSKDGFRRKGIVGDWRNCFTEADKAEFKAIAGQTLIDLGYEPDVHW